MSKVAPDFGRHKEIVSAAAPDPAAAPLTIRMEVFVQVRKFSIGDASFERSPGQDGDVFTGNVVDQRDGGPITIGYGRWGPGQSIEETMAVDDVIVVLEGRMSIASNGRTVTAGPGEIVYMPQGEKVVIRAHEEGAVTAYVTYPHWQGA